MRSDFNEIVKSYLGTYEITNKEVVGQFFKGARNSWITRTSEKFSSRYAWCAAFIYTMLKKAGKEPKYMPTAETIRAKSYIGEENGGLFKGTSILLDEAKEGDIIVLKRGRNMYHVGTYVSHDKGFIVVRGGNQSNRVKESNYLESALVDIVDYDSI